MQPGLRTTAGKHLESLRLSRKTPLPGFVGEPGGVCAPSRFWWPEGRFSSDTAPWSRAAGRARPAGGDSSGGLEGLALGPGAVQGEAHRTQKPSCARATGAPDSWLSPTLVAGSECSPILCSTRLVCFSPETLTRIADERIFNLKGKQRLNKRKTNSFV